MKELLQTEEKFQKRSVLQCDCCMSIPSLQERGKEASLNATLEPGRLQLSSPEQPTYWVLNPIREQKQPDASDSN